MTIAFLGTPRLAQIVLEKLISGNFRPGLVITGRDSRSGRGQRTKISAVKKTAVSAGIETRENFNSLPSFDLAILVAYGKIIPKEILDIPKYGFLNIHPSLLPKYRGPSPIISAILSGETKTGVTLMKLDKELDHGPVIAQKEIAIEKTDTHASLIEKLGILGSNLLVESIPDYIEGSLVPKPQNHKAATFTQRIKKQDGFIDLNNPLEPDQLDLMIRAYYPWPTVWTELELRSKNSKLRKLKIKFLPATDRQPSTVYRQPLLIQPEGKRPMTIKEFINGYPQTKPQMEKLLKQTSAS